MAANLLLQSPTTSITAIQSWGCHNREHLPAVKRKRSLLDALGWMVSHKSWSPTIESNWKLHTCDDASSLDVFLLLLRFPRAKSSFSIPMSIISQSLAIKACFVSFASSQIHKSSGLERCGCGVGKEKRPASPLHKLEVY